MDDIILNIINKIQKYIKTSIESSCEYSFDDFLCKNKDIFVINFEENIFISEDDVKLLYSMTNKNFNMNLILDYFNNSKVKVDKEILINIDSDYYVDYSELLFFKLILRYGKIIVYPKKKIILWNNEREKIVGTSLSGKFLKLNYIVPFSLTNLRFDIFIHDNISFSEFDILIDSKYISYTDININSIISDFIEILIKKIKNDDIAISYYRLFLTYKKLSYYILYILPDCAANKKKTAKIKDFIEISEKEETKRIKYVCEHEEDLRLSLIPNPKYFENVNEFARKYLDVINNISVCRVCKEYISFFNLEERSYLQKDGDFILTSVKDTIFDYEPYKNFVDANIFFFDILSIFDNAFRTNTINYINNISKISVDFFLFLSENRLSLEKDQRFKKIISDGKLFFLRLSNKFFYFF